MSRRMPMYSRVRARGFANGIPYQPSTTCGPDTPRPRMKRPPERWSIVMADIAVIAGCHPAAELARGVAVARRVVEHHEALHPRASHEQRHVVRRPLHRARVVLRHRPADHDASAAREPPERRVEHLAADVVEVHVDA